MSANTSEGSDTDDSMDNITLTQVQRCGRKSKVWEHFERDFVNVDGELKAVCKYCHIKMQVLSGTTSLMRHIARSCPAIDDDVRKSFVSTKKKQPCCMQNMEKRSGDNTLANDGTPKKMRAVRKVAVTETDEENEGAEDPKTLNVRLEVDTLECPLCLAPFKASIFQCKNGHAACESCCASVQGKCPSCRKPIGDIRCRPLEKLIASMLVPCAFRTQGCKEAIKYAEKLTHEAVFCQHAPCACPIPGCAYTGLLLHEHIWGAHADGGGENAAVSFVREATVTLHKSMLFRVLLHPPDSRVFLLLNSGEIQSGRSLSLLCVGPRPADDQALEYTMEVRAGRKPGALSLSASGTVTCTRRWQGPGHPPAEGFLFVPDAFWCSSGSISVKICLRKQAVVEKP
ncbi:hypothetical protein EJB05_31839 [Eragrostis curvula]|uniref:RING-type E3 ubiquitin transferase n=1 Tax=Eragrostis curvula TaxID=38414 RepID=A0A5J9UFP6_9POAL|nr:hypothetical protein EJB05_31839 [Eragrostis curvula]